MLEDRAAGQLVTAVDYGDVIETKEAALEDVVPFSINLVDPPREIDEEFVKDLLQKLGVGNSTALTIKIVDTPAGPGVHRRIQIGKFPFISRNLSVGVLELFKDHYPQIFFGKFRINEGDSSAVKSKVPGGKPWVLPLVRHGEYAHGIQMPPMLIANALSGARRRKGAIVTFQPPTDIEEIDLFSPEHSGKSLTLDHLLFV